MTAVDSLYAGLRAGASYGAPDREIRADVAVIGAGLTGLSTALHLARAGRSVVVLESEQPGWGASGRNGGQVNPGLKTTPEQVEHDFGPVYGPRLVSEAWNAPEIVYELIERYEIDCDAARGGTIRAATARSQLTALQELNDQCLARGGSVSMLTADAIAQRTGTNVYCGGMIDARGGQVDPLAYTRGLAMAATSEGAEIFGQSRVQSLFRHNGLWCVATAHGVVQAEKVVFATNGYTDQLWNRLRRSIVPVYSAIIASKPLAPIQRAQVLAQREVLYELGQMTTYYRMDADARLLIGGRSRSYDASGADSFYYLKRHAKRLWPWLRDDIWTHGWNGQLAVTLDHYPQWHNPGPGVYACLGYNGRGVAMATLTGRAMADHLVDDIPPLFPFSEIKPITGHAAWKVGVGARIAFGRFSDRFLSK